MRHVAVLLASIIWVYFFCVCLPIHRNKPLLLLAMLLPAAALIYFKYRDFVLQEVLGVHGEGAIATFSLFENTVLPAGISFFTFQLIGFAIDRYRGLKDRPEGLLSFGFYISFFPQLIAGPILRFSQVSERLRVIKTFLPSREDQISAILLFTFGLSFKVLIADAIGRYASPQIVDPLSSDVLSRLFVVFGYSIQIYFDFLGYSLMAMGLGRIFGFHFPDNFRIPYTSRNPKDFWRRWHITLSFWIRDYLYLPLGGNRRYVLNILIVFAAVGLWHGAGWNFIIWGLYHAMLVISYHLFRTPWDRLPDAIQTTATFILVSIGWVLFIF